MANELHFQKRHPFEYLDQVLVRDEAGYKFEPSEITCRFWRGFLGSCPGLSVLRVLF